jgi:hypothetical protein
VEGNNLHNKIAKGSWKLLLAGKGTCVCREAGTEREREREREIGKEREAKREKERKDTHRYNCTKIPGKNWKGLFLLLFRVFFLFSRK